MYPGERWILSEKSVSEILTILQASKAIPSRVIGYRNGQRVQRNDELNSGEILVIEDVPVPKGQVTVCCHLQLGERQEVTFNITGDSARMEELIRTEGWAKFQIEDSLYWVRSQCIPSQIPMIEVSDQETVLVKERNTRQYPEFTEDAGVIKTVTVRMDRERFLCTAPIQSIERLIRTTLRTQFKRTDSTYTLKTGPYLCTQRQLDNGGNIVDVVTTAPGGAQTPQMGMSERNIALRMEVNLKYMYPRELLWKKLER
jgi:hypothetical protein